MDNNTPEITLNIEQLIAKVQLTTNQPQSQQEHEHHHNLERALSEQMKALTELLTSTVLLKSKTIPACCNGGKMELRCVLSLRIPLNYGLNKPIKRDE